jgi:hypothetical protein
MPIGQGIKKSQKSRPKSCKLDKKPIDPLIYQPTPLLKSETNEHPHDPRTASPKGAMDSHVFPNPFVSTGPSESQMQLDLDIEFVIPQDIQSIGGGIGSLMQCYWAAL